MFSQNLDISIRYQTTKYRSLYNSYKIQNVHKLILSISDNLSHGKHGLLKRSIHILLKNSEKIGGHVLNKKKLVPGLHAPLFLIFSKMTQSIWYPSYFHFHIISKTVTNPLGSVTKMPS